MSRPRIHGAVTLALLFCAALIAPLSAALDPAPADAFTIVVIPDTQNYHGAGTKKAPESQSPTTNPVLDAHTRWIVENLETQRIAFVSHVGDIVDLKNKHQWELARELLDRLHGRVPYGLVVGNHDMYGNGDSPEFQKMFPASRFAKFDWYGGYYPGDPARPKASGNNANSYQLFRAGGLDFVFLHIECNAPDDVLRWADSIFEKHSNRIALVSTHMDLGVVEQPAPRTPGEGPPGRMRWKKTHRERGNTPQEAWDKCYRKHANLRFIFSGDQREVGYAHVAEKGDHGNTVHSLLSDYYSEGPLRLYRFMPRQNLVHVITYDTSKQALVASAEWSWRKYKGAKITWDLEGVPPAETPERATQQFTIECDLSPPKKSR